MEKLIKFNEIVHYENNIVTILEETFLHIVSGAVGLEVEILTKKEFLDITEGVELEDMNDYTLYLCGLERVPLIFLDKIKTFLKERNVEFYFLKCRRTGRIFKEGFNGNVSKHLNDEISFAESGSFW